MRRLMGSRIGTIIVTVLICTLLFGTGVALAKNGGNDDLRVDSIAHRMDNMRKAVKLWPDPILENFPGRKALVDFAILQDRTDQTWYIYLFNVQGEPLGYYVSNTYPQSTCNFLGSTEQVLPDYNYTIVQAPSYDGMFYGGSGAGSACSAMFFFDASGHAQIFNNPFWQASNGPIPLYSDAKPIGDTGGK